MYDRSIYFLIVVLMMTNMIYGLASPFLPTLLDDSGIKETWTGIIFAIYAIAVMIASLFVGKLIDKVGYRNMVSAGVIIMSASICGFGLVYRVTDKTVIIVSFLLLRFA